MNYYNVQRKLILALNTLSCTAKFHYP